MTVTSTAPPTMSRKWIDDEITRLDPETDWEQIYLLMTAYRTSDFMLDLMYTFSFPHFMIATHGPLPVWRDGAENNKVVQRASVRADDTGYHNMLWLWGPSDPKAQKSMNTINSIHAHYAKEYPQSFEVHEDYVYVWCMSAALMHRLRVKMGLPGFTEKEKVAAHRFWLETGKLMVVPGDTGDGHPADGYPADFDGILAWLEEFEGRDWPVNKVGRITCEAVIQQFEYRYVPRLLRTVFRTALYSFYPDSLLNAYEMPIPPRPLRAFLRRACGLALVVSSRGPDPTEHYMELRERWSPQERKERARKRVAEDKAFAKYFIDRNDVAPPSAGCPVLH